MTKYPIILVHGIALKDSKVFRSFGKIDRKLREQGYCVYVSTQDGFGTTANNAQQLKEQIECILQKENVEKVNLIAHSKGGLDCKYLIKELGMEDNVASLTTLCTPHKGSPVASKIMKVPKFMLKFVAFWVDLWYRICGDKHPDSYSVCQELQKHDNEPLSVSDKVFCQSFSTTMNSSRDDFVMSIPRLFFRHTDNVENDGLVSVESAMFANYRGSCIDEPVSHGQIVDFMAPKSKRERIYAFYAEVCKELSDMGF